MYEDARSLPLRYMTDTTRANACGRLQNMNQLQRWSDDGVIELIMSDVVRDEIAGAGTSAHFDRVDGTPYTIGGNLNNNERATRAGMERVLFPGGATTQNQRNDVEIVFQAKKYGGALITADGGSGRQPGGMLGRRNEMLAAFRVRILTDQEAVDEVREKISERDRWVRQHNEDLGMPLPGWLGQD